MAAAGRRSQDGIAAAAQLLARDARRHADKQRWLWVLSDGRTRETPARPDAADHVVFVDFDDAPVRIGQGARLARAWGAQWVTADELCAEVGGRTRAKAVANGSVRVREADARRTL